MLNSLAESTSVVMYLHKAMSQNNGRVYAMSDNGRKNIIGLSQWAVQLKTQISDMKSSLKYQNRE